MNDPPTPIFCSHKVAGLSIHQTGCVEERNRDTRNQKERQQRLAFATGCQRGFEPPPHQPQPENEAAKQQDLPNTAEIDVFITLRSQQEPVLAEILLDPEPFSSQRAGNDKEQCAKKNID